MFSLKRLSFQFSLLPRGILLNVLGGMGSGEEEGGIFLRFRLVCIHILSLLLSLESLEKFVWWWVVGGGGWRRLVGGGGV